MKNTVKIDAGDVKMIAHRGVSGLETENSIAAFLAAGNRSYYGIETDVHVTADGRFVVIHDDNAKRVSGRDVVVEQATLAELSDVRLNMLRYDGLQNETRSDLYIPTLGEYIGVCKHYDKYAILELKNQMKQEHILGIANEIRALGYLEKTVFISFCWDNLAILKQYVPSQTVQFLTGEWTDDLPKKLKNAGFDLDAEYRILTAERVKMLHDEGIFVNCWTCDGAEDAIRLRDMGVDYITSNILEGISC